MKNENCILLWMEGVLLQRCMPLSLIFFKDDDAPASQISSCLLTKSDRWAHSTMSTIASHYQKHREFEIVGDGDGFPIFCQVQDKQRFGRRATQRSGFRSQRPEPCNLSATSPLVINHVTIRLTSSRRLIPAVNRRTQARTT